MEAPVTQYCSGTSDLCEGSTVVGEWEPIGVYGSAWTQHTLDGSFAGAHSVFAVDLDGDLDMDVLGAGQEDGEFTWWENDCVP